MKISIENFKSIKKLTNFELRPMTILSGVNSSGKSSFIQLLLLLKQTIERNSANLPFYLDGELYQAKSFKDIVSNHDLENRLTVTFKFSKEELLRFDDSSLRVFKGNDYNILVTISFKAFNESIYISEFEVKVDLINNYKKPFIKLDFNGQDYSIKTNDNLFGNEIWNRVHTAFVNFISFYPLILHDGGKYSFDDIVLKFDWAKGLVNSFLENTSYIGPNRESPQDEYLPKRTLKRVSPTGDNVAQILENFAGDTIELLRIDNQNNIIKYSTETATVAEAVRYWMCDIFNVADDLTSSKIGENYRIDLISKSGLSTNIKHVGFGISQILPIIVEGLIMPNNGTIIVEQPEIHLHPKLQSLIFDFLYGLTLQGKKVIIETHSSHFITRMRRRIAEDENSKMDDRINLTFIEDNIFRSISLNDFGGLEYYPKDFIEQPNSELSAIVQAQMNKRLKSK